MALSCSFGTTRCVAQEKKSPKATLPYIANKLFSDQACWANKQDSESVSIHKQENVANIQPHAWSITHIYYPTLLPGVQISRETSTNNKYLYSPHSSRPREVQNLGKSEVWERNRWIINLLLDVLVCSIAVYFYSLFVSTYCTTRKNIQRYYTPKRLIRYIYIYFYTHGNC